MKWLNLVILSTILMGCNHSMHSYQSVTTYTIYPTRVKGPSRTEIILAENDSLAYIEGVNRHKVEFFVTVRFYQLTGNWPPLVPDDWSLYSQHGEIFKPHISGFEEWQTERRMTKIIGIHLAPDPSP